MRSMLRIFPVETEENLELVKGLFFEYAGSLGFDLGFQTFEGEDANLPADYAPPEDCLLLAIYKNHTARCVVLWKLNDRVCEARRVFARPQFRGLQIGRN